MKAIVVTNNLKVKQRYEKEHNVRFVDGSLLDVLIAVRDSIHEGHELLTHPLAGSVKPNETPYRSILISCDKKDLDLDSLLMISSSIETVQKFLNIKKPVEWKEKVLEDFMVIDLDLISSGIESMLQ